jgi:hypothetical protein
MRQDTAAYKEIYDQTQNIENSIMTSPQRSLLPACGNDRRVFLRALGFVARGRVQLVQMVEAVVGQRMPLEPGLQIFDGIEIGCIRWKIGNLGVAVQRIEIVTHSLPCRFAHSFLGHPNRLQ